jgi:hypothetical protein
MTVLNLIVASGRGTIGMTALWVLFGWLLSAIVGQYVAARKGYSEKAGLASGLLVPAIGPIVWLFVRPRPNSKWQVEGPIHRRRA